jgi:hypothetical protein
MSDSVQKPADEFDAARMIVGLLKAFSPAEQTKIIRWAQESLGIVGVLTPAHAAPLAPGGGLPPTTNLAGDIRSFIAQKKPNSDVQFAAAVAYFYAFVASAKKPEITAADLQDATRLADRERLHRPITTLHNAANRGYLDKGSEKGAFKINTVGENLVAMSLPTSSNSETGIRKPKARKGK